MLHQTNTNKKGGVPSILSDFYALIVLVLLLALFFFLFTLSNSSQSISFLSAGSHGSASELLVRFLDTTVIDHETYTPLKMYQLIDQAFTLDNLDRSAVSAQLFENESAVLFDALITNPEKQGISFKITSLQDHRELFSKTYGYTIPRFAVHGEVKEQSLEQEQSLKVVSQTLFRFPGKVSGVFYEAELIEQCSISEDCFNVHGD